MKRLLLDTHIALWAITDSPRLPGEARAAIVNANHQIAVSAISIWEIAIKHGLRREAMPIDGTAALRHFRAAGFEILGVGADEAAAVDALPAVHADPFDRLLVAQARTSGWKLLTADTILGGYGDAVVVVR
jgi:PIN domain nuclease of toxin-antitoxin system